MIFQYNHTPIYYSTFGNGPAFVLLHGFLESSTMWKPLIPQLSEKYTVITIDFPGHGKSGVVAESHTMELMADVVHGVLDHLGIKQATLMGHSMGGYVILAYIDRFSEQIDRIIMLNSTPLADSEEKKQNRNRALKVIDKNPQAYIAMAIGNLFAEASRERFSTEIERLKKEANSFPVEGVKAAIRGMRDRKDRVEVLKNFKKDKYLIAAKDDPIVPISEIQALTKEGDFSLKIVGGGHMSMIENWEIIQSFVHLIV